MPNKRSASTKRTTSRSSKKTSKKAKTRKTKSASRISDKDAETIAFGGQAVIEGVMMKSPSYYAVAVRDPDGKIQVKLEPFRAWARRARFLGWPLIRGAVSLFEIMILGMKCIIHSGNVSMGEEEEDLSVWEIIITIGLSLGFAFVIFKLLPLFFATRISDHFGSGNVIMTILDGLLRVSFFIIYIWALSFMKDIKTLFEYHGAEHKAVTCLEHDKPLTPREAQKFTTIHPRCGTTFIMIVLALSIIVYLFIPADTNFWEKLGWRVILLPLITGISYEFIRLAGKHYYNSRFVQIILAPGLVMQRLTTRRPNLKQLEVAIKALRAVLDKEGISYRK